MRVRVAIVPSERVKAPEFLDILASNGIEVEPLAEGSAKVCAADGTRARVGGVIVVTVRRRDLHRAKTHSRLCGVTLATLPNPVL